jgi:predicted lipoprotein with Yx(FWY)xxD motif
MSLASIILAGLLVTLTGCSDDDDDNGYTNPPPPPPPGGGGPSETPFTPATTGSTAIGQVLTNDNGMTLYVFENDRNDTDGDGDGDSDCNGMCADSWPPVIASATDMASGQFTIITRDDGTTLQWAFKGLPLYHFAGDSMAGNVNGEGVNNVWYVARLDPWTTDEVDDTAQGTVFVGARDVADVETGGGKADTRSDRTGFTLYIFENDRNDTDGDGAGDSDCNAACAEAWPPLYAELGETPWGQFTIIDRDDGSMQWAFKGLPLYFFVGDMAAGDTSGEGVNNLWYVARPDPFQTADSSIGTVFAGATSVIDVDGAGNPAATRADRNGFTLYVFDSDVADTDGDGAGDSDCNGVCAVNWPPLYADLDATATGDWTIIDRDDASRQWAFKGEPLYFFAGDAAAGDVNGDEVGGVWHAARPGPVQLFDAGLTSDIFAARGMIADVDGAGARAATFSDKTGFTVYLFDNDATDADGDGMGDSDCNGGCAVIWPPLYAEDTDTAAGDFTIIERDDGTSQWAYKGDPLYFYQDDLAPGDILGIYGTWHEVTP